MSSWPNQIYCHFLYKYITTLYEPNTLPIIKLSLQGPFLFQRKTTQSTKTQSLIQSMLGSLQNGKGSFISHHPTCSCSLSTIPTNNPFLCCNQFSLPFINSQLFFFTIPSLQALPTLHSYIPQPLFSSLFLHTAIPMIPPKILFLHQPSSQFRGPLSKLVLCGVTLVFMSPW